ncbi:hypothetical protein ACFQX6_38550 [Streptosporangium lutulentum]
MGKWLPGISRRSQARIQDRVSRLGARMTGGPRLEFRTRLREQLMEMPPEEDFPERQVFPRDRGPVRACSPGCCARRWRARWSWRGY